MPPCGLTRAFLLVVFAVAVQDIRAANLQEHPKLDYHAIVRAEAPVYPYECRRAHITGSGVVAIKIDPSTGKVVSCEMDPSTGNVELDRAALIAFRQWRFKPGTFPRIKIPIRFSMSGEVETEYHVKETPVGDALAAFLGKGTVEKGPIPAYPRSVPWTTKQGNGRYEIHVQKDGRVSEVKILKRSGDDIFDRTTVETLRQWRLHRGPLILELPLSFKLTPTHYSVSIPKER
ncbi:MAG: Gram-negative bacterial TonB protein C-terminal [Verrucomicrobiota bacterium]